MTSRLSLRRHHAVLLASFLGLVGSMLAPSAPATAARLWNCSPSVGAPVFAAWNDSRSYVLAPGGDFEAGSTWTFSGGASVGLGNESFFAHGLADTHSVTIPAGGSATTPALCIDPTQPTIRYFTAAADLAPAQLSVQLISTDVYGLTKTTQLGLQPVPGGWQLSHSFGLAQRRNSPSVQLRFSASGAAVRLDDVYIDPYIRA